MNKGMPSSTIKTGHLPTLPLFSLTKPSKQIDIMFWQYLKFKILSIVTMRQQVQFAFIYDNCVCFRKSFLTSDDKATAIIQDRNILSHSTLPLSQVPIC